MNDAMPQIACPFCGGSDPGALCLGCGRDKTAARRICRHCNGQTPVGEPACLACGRRQRNELAWKVPVIVGMFAAASAAALALNVY
ncbi:MAG: double zinc ribbon domain-containing protein [Alphaproteobacteria bacterium]